MKKITKDENNNIIKIEEYNDEGKQTHVAWFDPKNNKINNEDFFKYDKKGNLIEHKDVDGNIQIYKYDENNNMIYFKASLFRYEEWRKYDDHNNIIYYKDSTGKEQEIIREYNDKGEEIHSKFIKGGNYEEFYEYED